MNKLSAIPLLLVLFFSCTKQQPQQEPQVDADGWINLITDDLSLWSTVGDPGAEVTEGVLSLTATADDQGALLVSNDEFTDLKMEFEFLADQPGPGVLFRFNDKLRTVVQNAGYMISTDFNPDQQNPTGTILMHARATVMEDTNPTQWNKMTIEASGTHLMVYLNDELVAEVNDKKFSSGKIALHVPASNGQTAQFKNMRIQKLARIQVVTELLEDRFRGDDTKEWQELFDGSSLEGWTPIGDGTWKVTDGAIHGNSGEEGGFLVSDAAFKDFYLKTSFKIIKEDNSGIFIRKSPDSTAVTITDAIECNIYDHNGPSHVYSTGAIATHARAWYEMIDYNDWNEMEIFAEDNHIVMFVNGTKSSESYLPEKFAKAGNICLQGGIKVFAPGEGPSDVYFKEVMVKSFD